MLSPMPQGSASSIFDASWPAPRIALDLLTSLGQVGIERSVGDVRLDQHHADPKTSHLMIKRFRERLLV
jgi:hypothetical protein